jgi:3-methyladenine DNA glycosylase AlkD
VRLSETKEEYIRRKICWALRKCAEQHSVISIKRLRKLVSLPNAQLREFRDHIIEVATKLELTFDAHCPFAP